MENTTDTLSGLQQSLTDNLQRLTNISVSAFKPLMDNMMNNLSSANKAFLQNTSTVLKFPILNNDCDCCPPKNECPPHCIASITRTAMSGERILVPFLIKNSCSQTKTYRIGVRELVEQSNNQPAPFQPDLNKMSVTLAPNQSEEVIMAIDLMHFHTGLTYTTELVVREKEINQNICFTLIVANPTGIVTATPKDEKSYRMRWQSWKDHYYCEKPILRQVDTGGTLDSGGAILSNVPGK
jgi:hypothetical protein